MAININPNAGTKVGKAAPKPKPKAPKAPTQAKSASKRPKTSKAKTAPKSPEGTFKFDGWDRVFEKTNEKASTVTISSYKGEDGTILAEMLEAVRSPGETITSANLYRASLYAGLYLAENNKELMQQFVAEVKKRKNINYVSK